MRNAIISGTGGYVPPRVVTNDDLREQFGIDSWARNTGCRQPAFAVEHSAAQVATRGAERRRLVGPIRISRFVRHPGHGSILARESGLARFCEPFGHVSVD